MEKDLDRGQSVGLPGKLWDLTNYRPQPQAVRLIPQQLAERLEVLPLELTADGRFLVAAVDPLNLPAQDELSLVSGRRVEFIPALPAEIHRCLKRAYEVHHLIQDAAGELPASVAEASEEELSSQGPVIRFVDHLIQQAAREGASDIHIEPGRDESQVRFRVDGLLSGELTFPAWLHRAVISRIKVMARIDIAQKRRPQDGKILVEAQGRPVDLRVSTLPTLYGEKAVLRLLDRAQAAVGLEGLGCDADDLEFLRRLAARKSGLVLSTGPTGSGKTTTLYSLLELTDRAGSNVVTVEDPVEYEIAGVSQVQIDPRSEFTFPLALRSILRQDPDIIMVGEIRDVETAELAVRAALTGHFVLSSLHTLDGASAPARLIDMGIQPFLLAASLHCVISQRLLRRLCPHCRQAWTPSPDQCRSLSIPQGSRLWRKKGCSHCRHSGFRGRTAIFEIMEIDGTLSQLILQRANRDQMVAAATEKGMRSLQSRAIQCALDGTTSLEEALAIF